MNHTDHVRLLRAGIPGPGGVWADVGAGSGAFTLALADLVGPEATIHAIDRDSGALARARQAVNSRFPGVAVQCHTADFTQPFDLPPLDGIVMANALHFVREKCPVVQRLHDVLRPGGRLILVEYDTDRGNRWVPYPLTYAAWEALAARCGFAHTTRLTTHPSSFLGRFFSAVSV